MCDQEDPLSSLDRQERAGTFVPTLSRVAGTASIARSDEFRPAHTKPVALYCTSTISTQFAPFPTG
jgi:hypothetical protein